MNIDMAVDKAWEGKTLREIAEAPVDALAGVSAADAEKLEAAFGVRTVRDLAGMKFFGWAQAIVTLADLEMMAAQAEGDEAEVDEAEGDEAEGDEGDEAEGDEVPAIEPAEGEEANA